MRLIFLSASVHLGCLVLMVLSVKSMIEPCGREFSQFMNIFVSGQFATHGVMAHTCSMDDTQVSELIGMKSFSSSNISVISSLFRESRMFIMRLS